MENAWYSRSFRRNLVDMHIDDWDPIFLSKFDPQAYYECLKAAHIQTPMIYTHSHVGLCNWDSKSGRVHKAFAGENKVRKLFDLCHEGGMSVVARGYAHAHDIAADYADEDWGYHYCFGDGYRPYVPAPFRQGIDHILVKSAPRGFVRRFARYTPDYYLPLSDHSPALAELML